MVESKSGYFTNDFKAHSEKPQKLPPLSVNRLAGDSERLGRFPKGPCPSLKSVTVAKTEPGEALKIEVQGRLAALLDNSEMAAGAF